jgi:Lantibiotic dehydratase, N terminus
MPRASATTANDTESGPRLDDHLVQLAGDWALRRDFAVRSAGFPVSGLDAFGAEDESARLREVAADPAFREALTWQNRGALATVADGLLKDGVKPSKRRQREEVVARYWQRYCSKNDTIGFFGPLAWGEVRDAGPALAQRSRALVRQRTVHLEAWCLERFLQTVTDDPWLPLGPWPEEDARSRIESIADAATRERAETGLARLEGARERIAAASRDELAPALEAFDALFEELVGEPPAPALGLAGGGRTPVYMDSMRDLDVDLGPGLVAELAASLAPLLESSRWLCGRSFELGCGLMTEAVGSGGPRPLAPLFGKVFAALRDMPRLLAPEHDELQRRWADLLGDPDRATIGERARARFSDYGPAWPISVFHSPDIQIAATDVEAVKRGEYRIVIGDYHPGTNPLAQGVFSYRHPDRRRFLEAWGSDVGTPTIYPWPPRAPQVPMTARLMPAPNLPGDIVVLPPMPQVRALRGSRVVSVADLLVDGDTITDREGSFRAPLHALFWAPMIVATVFSYEPFPKVKHMERITLGRTVLRRESWRISVGDCPTDPAGVAAWASDHGMPRRLFVRLSAERKPTYLDVESPVLARGFCRQIRRRADAPDELVAVSEMLPSPEDCWLELNGERYTSELRLAAVDLTRRGHAKIELG